MYIYVILGMIYGHLLDDYVLQQILAKLKQKKFWEDNAPDELYKNDYLAGVICHAMEWTLSIHIAPFLFIIYKGLLDNIFIATVMFISIAVNTSIHAVIDNAKANKYKLSLIQDQLLHLVQIIVTAIILYLAISM